MFDGLKNKLSSFTEDAEEDVVEEVETDAVEEGEEDDGETVETDAVDDGATETVEAVETADGATDSQVAVEAAGAETETAETGAVGAVAETETAEGSETDAVEAETAETEPTDADTVEAEASESAGETTDEKAEKSRSLRERAKLFATGKAVIDEDDLAAHLEELEFALLGSDVEYDVTHQILDGVEQNLLGETRKRLQSTGNLVRDALREALFDVISVGQFDFDERVMETEKPVVIIFTGVNGVGKTTSIAKLSQYFENRGLSTVLANGDTYRAGANEQLEQHAQNLDKKIISHEQGSDPAAVIYDAVEYAEANDVDVVLGDTAGRLHTSDGLMDQLAKIDRVIDPDMTLFVDEAVAGQDAVNRAREFNNTAEIDGTILTKADADTQGGAAISIAHVTGKPILFLGTGQGYDDLERFDPEMIVDALLGE